MEEYSAVLEAIAQREIGLGAVGSGVCLLCGILLWMGIVLSRRRKKGPRGKGKKSRRQGLWAAAALSGILLIFVLIFSLGTAHTVRQIQRDVAEESFLCYEGVYTVRSATPVSLWSAGRKTVISEDGAFWDWYWALPEFFEGIAAEDGVREGCVVTAKHSGIVVAIEE